MEDTKDTKVHPSAYSAIDLAEITEHSATNFELYLMVQGRPVLYVTSPHWWTLKELQQLTLGGNAHLYYRTADADKVRVWRRIQKINFLPSTLENSGAKPFASLPAIRRVPLISDAAAELNRVLYEQDFSASVVAKGRVIASEMVRCIKEDPHCVAAIGKLARHDDYTYYHSSRVAAYSLAIAIIMSQGSDKELEQLALGCLFHDVGKSKIGLSVLNKPGSLTPPEWDLMRRHTVFGIEVLDKVEPQIFSDVAREIVIHHHEKLDGSGYPHGLNLDEISTEVRIAAFADVFDALTTPRPYQKSRSRYEAFEFIRHNLLPSVDRDVYKAVVTLFKQA